MSIPIDTIQTNFEEPTPIYDDTAPPHHNTDRISLSNRQNIIYNLAFKTP